VPRSGEGYVLAYAGAVCLAASALLAGASAGLRARQERMSELDRRFNVLKALGAAVTDGRGRRLPAAQVNALYAHSVREVWFDPAAGTVTTSAPAAGSPALPVFQWIEDGRPARHAFPVSGKGLWSTIYGYLALDATLSEIVGLTFYRHGETPGLGGEIEQPWFQEQFRGRRIRDGDHLRPIVIAKGAASPGAADDASRVVVDGISGATLTGRGVMSFLNRSLEAYAPYLRAMGKGG